MTKKKELKYEGPKIPRKSKKNLLEAITYVKAMVIKFQMYDYVIAIRNIESKLEEEYNMRIISPSQQKFRDKRKRVR